MKRKIVSAVIACVAALTLTGCGDPSIEDRVAYREKCEANGGRYWEGRDGLTLVLTMNCDLERQAVTP